MISSFTGLALCAVFADSDPRFGLLLECLADFAHDLAHVANAHDNRAPIAWWIERGARLRIDIDRIFGFASVSRPSATAPAHGVRLPS